MSERESRNKDSEELAAESESGAKPAAHPGDSPQEAAAQKTADQVTRLQTEKDELMQTMIRRQADFENYRKRIERERHEEGRRGVGRLLEDLLPALDAFERALRAHDSPAYEEYRKGLELIYRQLWDTAARHGLERIAAAGKPFDPTFHQAIESVATREHPEGTVVEVLQDGFLFHGRVLRPSVVRVAVAPEEASEGKPASVRGAR